jgi:capsular exopolysaccharide synthesis family protein
MLTTMEGRLQDLSKRFEAARDQAMAIPDSVLILARLRREVEVNGDLLAQLKGKYQEVMIQESGLIEEVKVIKPALEPSHPINMPNTLMNTVTGGIIGLVVGLVLALIVETMDTSLGTIEDVEEILGIPVLGVIPSIQEFAVSEKEGDGVKLRSEPLVTHFAPRSPVSEAYRSLRTNLQFIRSDKEAKAYLITSSSLQEGKTYNVVNLSLSLAQAGEKVLLIDADLRRPTVHHIFGLQRQPGLTDYIVGTGELESKPENTVEFDTTLTFSSAQMDNGWENVTNTIIDVMLGEFGIDDILKTPGLDNLHVINAGQGLLNPAEILRSPRFKEFLREVREHYDIIIIDTPPVLPVADAFEVAREVDGVILVYEVGRIGRGILNRAKVQLENMNSNVLGVILNNVKPDVAPDFYRYRTDYYYRAEGDEETEPPPSRWWDFLDKGFQGVFNKLRLSATAEGRRFNTFTLILLVGVIAIAGLAWQSYPTIKSAFQRRPDQKEFSAQERPQQKPIVPATTPKQTESESSELSPARESLKTSSMETAPHGQILEQTEMKPGQPVVSHSQSQEEIEPAGQTTEEQPAVRTEVVAPTPVTEDKAITEKEPATAKAASEEASIENFVEKWRRSWKEGDVQTYIGCYHSGFTTRGMDIQAWKNYKQDIFKRTPEREVQLSDIKIMLDGSIATVTFKQSYETKNYKDYGSKTLQLANYQGNWSILDESYKSLPVVAEPVDVAIQGFVEKWRRAWEEGDLQAYIACYHPDYKRSGMDRSGWGKFIENRFESSARRDIQLRDLHIKVNGSAAVVTFKQHYQTETYKRYSIKTLHLRRDQNHWTIFGETVQPLATQG